MVYYNSCTDVTRLVAGRLLHEAMHINDNYSCTIHVSYPHKPLDSLKAGKSNGQRVSYRNLQQTALATRCIEVF